MKVFVIAGEESGDILGAGVMQSLTSHCKNEVIFRGIGGTHMQDAGLNSLFAMEELSLMGIAEILPKVSHLLMRIKQTVDAIEAFAPDIVISIDAPDFSFRVAKGIKKRGLHVPVKAHYVAPTVWAWRPGRAKKVAQLYDVMFCLFPFEPPYFEKEGMEAVFVGHPIAEIAQKITEDKKGAFLKTHNLSQDTLKLGVFFGSRRGEVARMGPVFTEALKEFLEQNSNKNFHPEDSKGFEDDNLVIISPTLPHLKEQVEALLQGLSCQKIIITHKKDKYPAMAVCDMALATSGTVGLELSVLDVPHIIGYRVNTLTHQIAKRLITTKYAHLTNILLQKEVVPEFIQDECIPESLTRSLVQMTQDDTGYDGQKEIFTDIRDMIKGPENQAPSDICAKWLIKKLSAC